jgi:hypothetical protein
MAKKTNLDAIPDKITTDEWIGKISTWDEFTSTSPSGFHLTHSKALVAKHDLSLSTPEGQELETKRLQLIDWQVRLLNLAISNRPPFTRWKTVVNVTILKEPGNFKIHRLRTIHLYEHDYNLILAVKWRQLIQRCTRLGTINEGQFSSVPGRDAVMPTIIEELQYEICRASKRPMIHFDWDAMACYDRIVLSLGSLIERGQGMHRNVVIINAETLREVKLILKTQLGLSEASLQNSNTFKIY